MKPSTETVNRGSVPIEATTCIAVQPGQFSRRPLTVMDIVDTLDHKKRSVRIASRNREGELGS